MQLQHFDSCQSYSMNIISHSPLSRLFLSNSQSSYHFIHKCFSMISKRKLFFFKILFIFREMGREEERGRNIEVRERCIKQVPLVHPHPGTGPTTQACALTGNRTGDLPLCGKMPNQLSPTAQGTKWLFYFCHCLVIC